MIDKPISPNSHTEVATQHKTSSQHSAVMDVLPWPAGRGFEGGQTWWKHLLTRSEIERLDNLIGLALLNSSICEKLVVYRDRELMSSFDLSEQTQQLLSNIQASTLQALAQAILSAPSQLSSASETDLT